MCHSLADIYLHNIIMHFGTCIIPFYWVHVGTVMWVRIPPGAAHFFFEKRESESQVVLL